MCTPGSVQGSNIKGIFIVQGKDCNELVLKTPIWKISSALEQYDQKPMANVNMATRVRITILLGFSQHFFLFLIFMLLYLRACSKAWIS